MDRSQQGVVPRTCLSKNTVKPRQGPPPQGRPGGPGPRGPNSPQMRGPPGLYGQPPRPMTPQGPPRPMTPQGAPRPMTPQGAPRPMTPQGGRNSPAPYAQPGRPMTPTGRNSPAPMGRPRAQSNAGPAPYQAYAPQARSMSPGPYGAPGLMKPPTRPDEATRRRSNSMGSMGNTQSVKPLSPTNSMPSVARKPVPGRTG
jgi:hypothetical protein